MRQEGLRIQARAATSFRTMGGYNRGLFATVVGPVAARDRMLSLL